jgi:hypothetical protein
MKPVMGWVLALLASVLLFTPSAKAWNCSDPLASRVNVGSTKPSGTAGDGDGQYYIGSDASNPSDYYVCEVPTPPTPTGGNSNANSTSTSASNSNSTSQSASASSATGGKSSSSSTANGGTATGGNATGGSSNSSVSASGNSNVTNNVNASGGAGGVGGAGGNATAKGGNQKQTQSQSLANSGNSAATASGNGVGNGNNSDNSSTVINNPRMVATAIAPPVYGANSCFKGVSGGAQTATFGLSFGGGKIDENCAILETSRMAPSIIARCKVYLLDKYAKEAGVSMEDCLPIEHIAEPAVVVRAAPPAPVAPQIIEMPSPVVNVTIIPPAPAPAPINVAVAARKYGHEKPFTCTPTVPRGKNPCKPVITNDSLQLHQQ